MWNAPNKQPKYPKQIVVAVKLAALTITCTVWTDKWGMMHTAHAPRALTIQSTSMY